VGPVLSISVHSVVRLACSFFGYASHRVRLGYPVGVVVGVCGAVWCGVVLPWVVLGSVGTNSPWILCVGRRACVPGPHSYGLLRCCSFLHACILVPLEFLSAVDGWMDGWTDVRCVSRNGSVSHRRGIVRGHEILHDVCRSRNTFLVAFAERRSFVKWKDA